jgi:hypothetical protein
MNKGLNVEVIDAVNKVVEHTQAQLPSYRYMGQGLAVGCKGTQGKGLAAKKGKEIRVFF